MGEPISKVLTIAGSDSGGGAGIQADIKTLTSLRVYATSVITSVTSQNTLGVNGIHDLPVEFIEKQIRAVLDDIGTHAVKTGMLSSATIITMVARVLKDYANMTRNLVVDPVMVSTSGSQLLAVEAIKALKEDLIPLTLVLTPNIPEAEVLLGLEPNSIQTVSDMRKAAEALGTLGPKYVLLKGGHLPLCVDGTRRVVDILYDTTLQQFYEYGSAYIDTQNTHGTGCTLSAAIAGELARGKDVHTAIQLATDYIQDAISMSLGPVGNGRGPVNHFHTLHHVPFSGSFVDALIQALPSGLWKSFVQHPFVQGIANGTLPPEHFKNFIKQDYLYLQQYARCAALAAYKSDNIDMCARNAEIILHIQREMQMHLKYCEEWGITKQDILNSEEHVLNVAYTRFVLDKGASGDQLDLQVAMAPCLLGYGEIGLTLYNDSNTKREGNPYWAWIMNYAGDEFQQAVRVGRELLEELGIHSVSTSTSLFKRYCRTFEQATRLEVHFWEIGMEGQK